MRVYYLHLIQSFKYILKDMFLFIYLHLYFFYEVVFMIN